MLPAQPNQSLIDGLAVLQALTVSREPIGGRAMARRLVLEPTRVNRLLKTLAHLGLAHQGADRRYAVGPGVHVLAAQSLRASGLIRRAIEPLRALHRFGCIVAMGVLWRTEVCYTYFARPGWTVEQSLGSCDPHAATTSGLGMAMLADLPDEQIVGRFAGGPAPGYADTEALLAHVREIRETGYALSTFGRPAGEATLAISVGQPSYAAIGLAGRMDEKQIKTYVAALREAAARIESDNATGDLT